MKKFYSLLTAACFTASAFALVPDTHKVANYKVPENISTEILQKMNFDMKDVSSKKAFRIKNEADGSEWACLIAVAGQLMKDITDYPYYEMIVSMQPIDGSSEDLYQLEIAWPTYGALDDMYEEVEGGLKWDRAKVEAKYGDKAFQPYSYEDFVEANGGSGMFITLPALYYAPCILGTQVLNYDWTVAGKTVYPMAATLNGNQWDTSNACTWNWSSFDFSTSDIKVEFNGKYSTVKGSYENPAQTYAGQTVAELSGAGVVLGFANILWDTVGEIHIFNGGRQEAFDNWTLNYGEQSTQPLNFYYICFCDETMGYMWKDKDGKEDQCYTNQDLPTNGAPGAVFNKDYHMTYFAGAIWAPENSELPYGTWSMKEPAMDNNVYVQKPEAYNLAVPYLKDNYLDLEAFHGSYEGYRIACLPGKTFLGIGDKKLGLNYKITGSITNGYSIMGSVVGNIIYHNTPDKWVDEYEMLPAVGNVDADVITSAVEEIESDAPVVSKTYYNFQGQRLSGEPENGMYIVRAIKADGTVKTTKIAK